MNRNYRYVQYPSMVAATEALGVAIAAGQLAYVIASMDGKFVVCTIVKC